MPERSEGERADSSSEVFLGGKNRAVLRKQTSTAKTYFSFSSKWVARFEFEPHVDFFLPTGRQGAGMVPPQAENEKNLRAQLATSRM